MDRTALSQLSKDELITLLLAQEERHPAAVAAMPARLAELERRLGRNSSTSGKPPSRAGLTTPRRVRRLRAGSGKKSGGPKGHPGETRRQRATPDAVIDHAPPPGAACGAPLTAAMATGNGARHGFDRPEPRPLVVTEHRAHGCCGAGCGAQTRAAVPDGVSAPVQSGKRIGAVVLDLLHDQRLSEPRLAGLMADRFSVSLVTATIVRISQDCAERVLGVAETVRNRVAAAPVKHRDETGFRMGGKTQWWHVASTMRLTVDRVAAKRGRLPETMTGIVVHDHGTPYSTLTDVRHALCNAHHRRERQARVEIAKADWALRMQPRLRRAGQAVNRACAGCAAEAGTDRADRTAFRRHRRRWPGVP